MQLSAPAPAEAGPLALVDLPEPEPGPGELCIEVAACGACHTDLHTVEGDLELPRLPLVPGHQVVGKVRAVGEGVTGFAAGDRVGAAWLYDACGRCRFCRKGRENLCKKGRYRGLHVDGGYAEVALANAEYTFPVPPGFSDLEAAPLLCAGIIGFRALRLSRASFGQVLGLYGFGASAHVTIQVAVEQGIEVYVFSRSEEHLEHARRLGAVWTGRAGDAAPKKLDAAICFAPAGELVPEILAAMERGATLALAGVTMTKIPELDYDSLLYQERMVRSVANFTKRDAEELLQLAADIPIRTDIEVHPLAAANEVLVRMKESRINGAAVLKVG
jgi:propanol-preferring alcohol dehydrogenase